MITVSSPESATTPRPEEPRGMRLEREDRDLAAVWQSSRHLGQPLDEGGLSSDSNVEDMRIRLKTLDAPVWDTKLRLGLDSFTQKQDERIQPVTITRRSCRQLRLRAVQMTERMWMANGVCYQQVSLSSRKAMWALVSSVMRVQRDLLVQQVEGLTTVYAQEIPSQWKMTSRSTKPQNMMMREYQVFLS